MGEILTEYRESLHAFLDGIDDARRQQAAVFIASRAALRVAPMLHDLLNVERNEKSLTPLLVLRPLLISSVAANTPTDDIKSTAVAAVEAAAESVAIADAASVDVARAAVNAADAVVDNYDAVAVAATSAGDASARATFAAAYVWQTIQHDADLWVKHADAKTGILSIDIAPLWDGANPMDAAWKTLQDRMRTDPSGGDWSFWINWYQGILDGTPQNWPMQHEIATTDRIDWDAPAKEVNDKINGIVEAYALKNSYYYERIEFSEAKQKLIAVPEGSFDGNTVEMAYQRLRDAIEDVRAAPKEGNLDPEYALRVEIRILERTLDRPTSQPIFVVEKCFDCIGRIQSRLDDATIHGADVEDFQRALKRSAFDIIGADEDARRIFERRTNDKVLSLAKEDRNRLSRFVEEAAPILDADLKVDLETDLGSEDDPQTVTEGSTLRGGGRILRILHWIKSNPLQTVQLIALGDLFVMRAIELFRLILRLFY